MGRLGAWEASVGAGSCKYIFWVAVTRYSARNWGGRCRPLLPLNQMGRQEKEQKQDLSLDKYGSCFGFVKYCGTVRSMSPGSELRRVNSR